MESFTQIYSRWNEQEKKKKEMEKLWHIRTPENNATSKNRYNSPSEGGEYNKIKLQELKLFFKNKTFNKSRKMY